MYYKIQRKFYISKQSKKQILFHYCGLFVSGLLSSNVYCFLLFSGYLIIELIVCLSDYSYVDYFNMILVQFELRNFEYVSQKSVIVILQSIR
jgi:hypothetical protein